MIDELRQIAIFAKTIDHGSFRGAAEELRLSPSVVSHHIAQLEEKLGVALIYRSTRRLTLTNDGEKLLQAARTMLDAAETGLSALYGHSSEPMGVLRVTLPAVLSKSPLIAKLARFQICHRKIKIQLEFSDERKNLIEEGYDLAIRMEPNRSRAPNRKSLFKIARSCVATSEYLSKFSEIERPEALDQCDWIEFAPARKIKRIFHKAGEDSVQIKPTANLSTNNALAAYNLAKAGAGIALIPNYIANDDILSEKVVALLPDWQVDMLEAYAEWPPNSPKNSLTKLLLEAL